jgi:hypothetical protein
LELQENRARSLSAPDAINTIYFNDMEIISIEDWKVVTTKLNDNPGQELHQHKQYHAYFAPMTIENWALSIV